MHAGHINGVPKLLCLECCLLIFGNMGVKKYSAYLDMRDSTEAFF